ncbi:hypothetical protein EYV94_19160 [Puteibacter caeruleilacunae]|nr:hypothetical protein EYV94_19160 [Puteibacter caeruleilacunae]
MKTIASIIFAIGVFFASLFAGNANAGNIEGQSHTWLGEYTITKSAHPVELNGSQFQAWVLKYHNSDKEVLIVVDQKKKCKNYVVKTDRFEIQYTCNKNGLGVKKLGAHYVTLDSYKNYGKMNDAEFTSQKRLTMKQKSEEDAIALIACYFPKLLKKEYKKVL